MERTAKQRQTTLVLTVVLTLSFVGFFVGVRQQEKEPEYKSFIDDKRAATAPLARSNAELAERPWSSQLPAWEPNVLPALPTGNLVKPNAKLKLRTIAARYEQRAFEGAPPTIPHPVAAGSGAAECQVCHTQGTAIGAVIAPAMSHAKLTMCTQCHAAASTAGGTPPAMPKGDSALAAATIGSNFEGLRQAAAPFRANAMAPPQIPHPTFMRESCLSCHGPSAKPGLQTSHPERQSCQQCHASSAVTEQRQLGSLSK